ncbi:MAG: hypothetical protein Kow0045_10950 [Albidovulum sp.]
MDDIGSETGLNRPLVAAFLAARRNFAKIDAQICPLRGHSTEGFVMVDKNLQRFYNRVGRIEKIHAAGGGFEADGTLGMSYYNSQRRGRKRRIGLLGSLVLVMLTVVGIKAAVHATIGQDAYQERIAALEAGNRVEVISAYILQADPLTQAISERIRAAIY